MVRWCIRIGSDMADSRIDPKFHKAQPISLLNGERGRAKVAQDEQFEPVRAKPMKRVKPAKRRFGKEVVAKSSPRYWSTGKAAF